MSDAAERWVRSTLEALRAFDPACLDPVTDICVSSLRSGGTLFFCGNGGSAADSQHFAAEFTGRFLRDREPLRAVSLSDNPAALTAISNDWSFDQVFSRQLRALGRPGDVLFAISTSGASPNVLEAVRAARGLGMRVVAMTGAGGAGLASAADAAVVAPSGVSGHVQEVLMSAGHAVCAAVEAAMAGAEAR